MKKCTPLWREAHFQVKCTKHTPCSDHFWKLRCQKSARRCGAKHVSKSKVQEMRGTEHFWTFRRRCVWQAQGTVHLVKSEHNSTTWSFVAVSTTTTTTHTPLLSAPLRPTTLQLQVRLRLRLHLQLQLHYITLHYTNYITLH